MEKAEKDRKKQRVSKKRRSSEKQGSFYKLAVNLLPRIQVKPGNMLYPVPAVMVSCAGSASGSAQTRPNIITVAWAGTVCTNPPMVSISIRPERYSYALIRESGCFVINLTTRDLTYAMDFCGVRSGRDVDKFEKMSLTAIPGVKTAAPMIAESPVNIECKVTQVLELGSHHMFLASVEAVHVAEYLVEKSGRFNLEKANLVAYSHGTYYELGKVIGSFGYSVRRTGR